MGEGQEGATSSSTYQLEPGSPWVSLGKGGDLGTGPTLPPPPPPPASERNRFLLPPLSRCSGFYVTTCKFNDIFLVWAGEGKCRVLPVAVANLPGGKSPSMLHFIDSKTENQRGRVPGPRSHICEEEGKPRFLTPSSVCSHRLGEGWRKSLSGE